MSNKKEIVVTDWIKQNCHEGNLLNLTLSSDQRRVFRGKRKSDCNQELQLQLPREGKLNDGDILRTNQKKLFVFKNKKLAILHQLKTLFFLN